MKRLITFCFCLNLLLSVSSEACTRIFWNDGSTKLVARTMDLFKSDEPEMWVNPRGLHRQNRGDDNGLQWISQYGSVTMTAFHEDFVTDGLNEHGLGVHVLALLATKYEPRDARPGVHYGLWTQYLLDTCRTVEEALEAHKHFQVVPVLVNDFEWPLHIALNDATGDSAIIEFINGEMKVYRGEEYLVLTNDPPLDEQWDNAQNYAGLGGSRPLPADTTSVSRFVIASEAIQNMPKIENGCEACALQKVVKKVVQTGRLTDGMIVNTYWTTMSDLAERTYSFIPADGSNGFRLNLKQLNFYQEAPEQIPL